MPTKAKSGKNFEKSTAGPSKLKEPTTSSMSALPPEIEQQFEAELCWCIQQLQTGLKSGKLNNKQVQDHTKALNTLMSNTAPMIKKRQVMRLSFGDYRAKMVTEEKKHSRNAMKMRVKPAVPSKKSVFVKKSSFTSSENKFQFNFEPPNDDELSKCVESVKIDSSEGSSQIQNKDFTFVPSDNSFRFGFSSME